MVILLVFFTPILVLSCIGTASVLLQMASACCGACCRVVVSSILIILGTGFLGVSIWCLVIRYEFWNLAEGDSLSGANKHLFFCAGSDISDGECIKQPVTKDVYLMYYADVIGECLFYIYCGMLGIGVVIAVLACCVFKKTKAKMNRF
eukprot:gnl/Chilomastix_caulleri/445.p1 GENE.gnl/Chilomastix_caulleri/445~~gnl/Chilomastix_caulleri/445.p1  ORF type:complete len:148 (+),score=17.86 gnl/Chilomastix_caulleri/445:267-710(+)